MWKRFIASCLSLFILSLVLPNITYASWLILIIAGVTVTLVQTILQPVLKILLLPITIITLGIFNGAINVILLWAVTAAIPGFHIDPMKVLDTRLSFFFSLVVVSFLLSLLQTLIIWFFNLLFKK